MIIRKIMIVLFITGWSGLSVWSAITFFTGEAIGWFPLGIIIINAMLTEVGIIFLIICLWENAEAIENSIRSYLKDRRAIKYSKKRPSNDI